MNEQNQTELFDLIVKEASRNGLSMPMLAKKIGVTYAALRNLKYHRISNRVLGSITKELNIDFDNALQKMEKMQTRKEYLEKNKQKI